MTNTTEVDNLYAKGASAKIGDSLPGTPDSYYDTYTAEDIDNLAWEGGELFFHTDYNRLYCQTATSGQTPTWKRLTDAWATTTSTSTSTTTSSSTSTSSCTTSTSSSTSTSTSSTTSTSTSTSSTSSSSTSTSSTTTGP